MNKVLTSVIFALTASPVFAEEPVCMPREELEAALTDWYGETPLPGVFQTETATMQLWVSRDAGTWTLVKYLIDGSACAVTDGEDLERSASTSGTIAALIQQ